MFTGVRAIGLSEGEPCRIETTGGEMRAREVVVATHYPIFDRGLFFGRLSLTRDLVVAGPAPGWAKDLPGTYFAADTGHSVRTAPLPEPPGGRLLIVGGEHFRTGEEEDVDGRYGRLAAWARERLGLEVISHRWSAHDMGGADGLPYIGRYHPAADHVWVATGFAAWGMTNGTLAGLILAELVTGGRSQWATLYEPNRLNLLASAKSLASNNITVARHEITDRFVGTDPAPASLKPGEAAVTRLRRPACRRLSRPGRRPALRFGPVHPPRLRRRLEQRREDLGLPLPRVPLPARRRDHRGPRDRPLGPLGRGRPLVRATVSARSPKWAYGAPGGLGT